MKRTPSGIRVKLSSHPKGNSVPSAPKGQKAIAQGETLVIPHIFNRRSDSLDQCDRRVCIFL